MTVSSALLFLLGALWPHHALGLVQICEPTCLLAPEKAVISEFYPYALAGDEYVVVTNVGEADISLLGWSLSDGEGSLTFGPGLVLPAGGSSVISFNSSSYRSAFGVPPDIALDVPGNMTASGTFRLANDGDSIELISESGETVDFVCYGDVESSGEAWVGGPVPCLRPGEVAKRLGGVAGPVDTDSSSDWTPFRQYKYGYTSFEQAVFDLAPGELTCLVSPDCALGPVLQALGDAVECIRVCAYELGSPYLTSALAAALDRGVSVRVLVEGKPVGGMSEAQVASLSSLATSGAEVFVVDGVIAEDVARHVGALHAKYVVIDGISAIMGSENFVASSLSEDPVFGNRGWWAMSRHRELARFLETVFESDCRSERPDVVEWLLDERHDPLARPAEHPAVVPAPGLMEPFTNEHPVRATVFVSPDTSVARPYVLDELSRCTRCLAEQLQADLLWADRWTGEKVPSPVLDAVLDILRSGGEVRMLLDSSWFSKGGNEEVVEYLRGCTGREGLSGEFALIAEESPVEVLHNKGLVLDDRKVLISSNNWVHSSFFGNRELAVLLESEEAAGYFTRAFGFDWTPDVAAPVADAGEDRTVQLGTAVLLSALNSTDDRAIARYEWDIDADGQVDCRGPVLEFVATRPGNVLVVLRVVDSWGNAASDVVVLDVCPELAAVDGPRSGDGQWTACAAGLGASVGVLLARRAALRRARSRPRKINHPRAAFRRRDADPAVRPGGHPGHREDSEIIAR